MNRGVLVSTATSFLPRAITLLAGPFTFAVITRRLSPEELGSLSLLLSLGTISVMIFTAGLRKYVEYAIPGADPPQRYKVLVTVLPLELALFVVCIFALHFPASSAIARAVKFPLSPDWLWLAPLLWSVYLLEQRILNFLSFEKRVTLRFILSSIEALCYISGLLVLYRTQTTVPRILAVHVTAYGTALVLALGCLNWKVLAAARPSPALARAALAYSLPLILMDVSKGAIDSLDRFILPWAQSPHELGLYAYAQSYINVAYSLVIPVITALNPYFADAYRRALPERRELFLIQMRWTLTLAGFAAAGLVAHRAYLIPLISVKTEYLEAGAAFFALLPGPVFLTIMNLYLQVLLLEGETRFIGRQFAAAAIGNIALNFLLAPRFSLLGSSIAWAATFGFLAATMMRRCAGRGIALEAAFLVRFLAGWLAWLALLFGLRPVFPGSPAAYLIVTMLGALPFAQALGLIDVRQLFRMARTA